jgi:hypothetical protein
MILASRPAVWTHRAVLGGCFLLCLAVVRYLALCWEAFPGVTEPVLLRNKTSILPDSGPKTPVSSPSECALLPSQEDVLIVLKTGATEIYDKLPIHLATTFTCATEFLIYSDLAQEVGDVHIHDALALLSPSIRKEHEDLAQYRLLQQHIANGGNAAELKGEKSWQLDKWKFLPMVSDAYRQYGDAKKWFVSSKPTHTFRCPIYSSGYNN